ncbi:hypothetical protein ACFVYJ_01675 [Pontibacter sp. JAM-7]|uniref:hypothetical protein n=1 Tax=Pontibacter sp. JAM-7 TaxID=3366581 RepID=UPI003AF9EBF5
MEGNDFTELLLETAFLWQEISVGDRVMLDADLCDAYAVQLKRNHPYQVVAKLEADPLEKSVLVVESDYTGELVQIHPSLICSYQSAVTPVILS